MANLLLLCSILFIHSYLPHCEGPMASYGKACFKLCWRSRNYPTFLKDSQDHYGSWQTGSGNNKQIEMEIDNFPGLSREFSSATPFPENKNSWGIVTTKRIGIYYGSEEFPVSTAAPDADDDFGRSLMSDGLLQPRSLDINFATTSKTNVVSEQTNPTVSERNPTAEASVKEIFHAFSATSTENPSQVSLVSHRKKKTKWACTFGIHC